METDEHRSNGERSKEESRRKDGTSAGKQNEKKERLLGTIESRESGGGTADKRKRLRLRTLF